MPLMRSPSGNQYWRDDEEFTYNRQTEYLEPTHPIASRIPKDIKEYQREGNLLQKPMQKRTSTPFPFSRTFRCSEAETQAQSQRSPDPHAVSTDQRNQRLHQSSGEDVRARGTIAPSCMSTISVPCVPRHRETTDLLTRTSRILCAYVCNETCTKGSDGSMRVECLNPTSANNFQRLLSGLAKPSTDNENDDGPAFMPDSDHNRLQNKTSPANETNKIAWGWELNDQSKLKFDQFGMKTVVPTTPSGHFIEDRKPLKFFRPQSKVYKITVPC
eukprot:Selendium_serpulae@DN3556_c0_g1_i1.p1